MKKNKQTKLETETENEQEEKLVDKNIPDIHVAFTFVRDRVVKWIYPICNLSKQEKYDLSNCIEYIGSYISKSERDIEIADYLQKLIDDSKLQSYNKTYEDNGYEVSLTITKKK